MNTPHELDRFLDNCARTQVDLLLARLGIPAPTQDMPRKVQSPPLIDRPWFIACMYVVCLALFVADCARFV